MASHDSSAKANNDYVNELIKERKNLSPQYANAHKLLQQELDRLNNSESGDDSQRKDSHIMVHTGKQVRLKIKVHIPVDENPNFNFVGKLLGPKGSNLQQLQEVTQTRMAILGRGSMRDKKKEEELRIQGDPKYSHLVEELHVEVSAYAPAAEAYRRMSVACAELQRFLVPDYGYEDMRGPQFDGKPKPPQYANEGPPHMPPRGGPIPPPPRPMGPPMMQGREPPRRTGMVQSTYTTPEAEEWAAPRPAPRRGGYNSAAPPARAARIRTELEKEKATVERLPQFVPRSKEEPLLPLPFLPKKRVSSMTYEEPATDYNSYGDGYGEYNSGNTASYYDYAADPEPSYADGYADARGPMRSAGGARGRNNARPQSHPYSGATRRGY